MFRPSGSTVGTAIEFSYSDIASWDAIVNDDNRESHAVSGTGRQSHARGGGGGGASGIEIRSAGSDGDEGGGRCDVRMNELNEFFLTYFDRAIHPEQPTRDNHPLTLPMSL